MALPLGIPGNVQVPHRLAHSVVQEEAQSCRNPTSCFPGWLRDAPSVKQHRRAPCAQEDSARPEGWYRALLYAFAAAHWAVLLAGCAAAPHVHPLALLGVRPTQVPDAQGLCFFVLGLNQSICNQVE